MGHKVHRQGLNAISVSCTEKSKDYGESSQICMMCKGVKVPITSSLYGYTKVSAHNMNSKKTSGAAIG